MIQIKTELFKEVNIEVTLSENEKISQLMETLSKNITNISLNEKKRIVFSIFSKDGKIIEEIERYFKDNIKLIQVAKNKIEFSLINSPTSSNIKMVKTIDEKQNIPDYETNENIILRLKDIITDKAVRNGQILNIKNQVKLITENINVGAQVLLENSFLIVGSNNNGKIKMNADSFILLNKSNTVGDIELNEINIANNIQELIKKMKDKEKSLFLYTDNNELCYYIV